MAKPRPRNRERTIADLLAAARTLVEQRPYDTIRVSDIAEAAGCSHGLITQYFGSRLGLFTQVLQEMAAEIKHHLVEDGPGQTVLDQPVMATYWPLLAALLDAGLDPSDALVPGVPAVDSILRRAGALADLDLEHGRAVAGFVILMVGGYHVFGDVLLPVIAPSGDPEEARLNFARTLQGLLRGFVEIDGERPLASDR